MDTTLSANRQRLAQLWNVNHVENETNDDQSNVFSTVSGTWTGQKAQNIASYMMMMMM